MKQIILFFFVLISSVSSIAQDNESWSIYMTPNEVHKMLGEYAGEFNVEISVWTRNSDESTIVNVSSVNKMILGGSFLEMRQSGDIMGVEYQSVVTLGFNTISHLFELATISNSGTGFLFVEGPWNKENKVAILKGQMINPMNREIIKIQQKISFVDKDNLLIESFDTLVGQPEKKTIQYKFVRKK